MKFAFILFAFVFSLGTWAQDPCNRQNLLNLIDGYPTQFYSRAQANACLLLAKSGGVEHIKVENTRKNLWSFKDTMPKEGDENLTPKDKEELERKRFLKLDKKDFFISKTILGKYRVLDREEDGTKASSNDRFIPKVCVDPSPQICESKNPPQNFDADTCTCVDKEKLFCGDKNLTWDKKEKAKNKCDGDKMSWVDETCECTKETFCGEKKWSSSKKEKEVNKCLGEKKKNAGYIWDDITCSCEESKNYCGDKKWTLKQLKKEEKSCPKGQKWNPDTCACDGDETKFSCNGKVYDVTEKKSCEDKSTDKVTYSWIQEPECKCVKEKVTILCEGENVGKGKYDRKQQRCLDRMAKDDRWSWDEEKCDCIKEEETETDPLCDGKRMSQRKYDRKKNRCDERQGTWDKLTCKCDDPCYEIEEPIDVETETCTDMIPELGDVKADDLGAKICEKAIPETEKDAMKAACKEKVDAIYANSTDTEKLTPIEIEIDYTSQGQVLCDDKIVAIKSEKEINRSLPSNVPTTDPNAFTEVCPSTLKGDLNMFHPKKISCAKMEDVKAGHQEIVTAATEPFDKFFEQLEITPPISKEDMDNKLKDANFNLEVIGTANRSNNGTGITLDDLALKRKEEAERIIKYEMTKKLASMVKGGVYTVPSTLFTNTGGISQAVGPLNPAASYTSMMSVLKEPGSAALKTKCGTKKTTKELFDCSVDYFIDDECPTLAPALKVKFCDGDKEAQRTNLKSQTTVDFLADFKMFQIGVDMKTESRTPVIVDIGTIKVKCNAAITSEGVTEGTTTVTEMLKVTKPGFFRRLKKDCREERKDLNEKFGRKNVRKAANQRKNPNGIIMRQTTGTSDESGNVIIPTTVIEDNYPRPKGSKE